MKLTQDWNIGKKRISLDMLMQQRLQPYSMQEAKLRLLPVLRSLIQLHIRGEAHGGIYPANLFIDEYGYFTLGKPHKKAAENQLLVPYLAFEQYAGEAQRTYSDVYALGAVLFFLVTRQEPDTVLARLQNDTLGERLAPFVSERDRAALLAALAIKKEERLHDVAALINALGLAGEFNRSVQADQVQPIQVSQSHPMQVSQIQPMQAVQSQPMQAVQSQPGQLLADLGQPAYVPQPKKMRRPISRNAVLITCIILLLGAIGTIWMISGISYRQAVAYVDKGDYAAARTAITGTVIIYRDAKQLSYYINSWYFLELGYYNEAKERFESLGKYRNAEDMVLECDYQKALAILDLGDRAAAKKAFEALGGYSDASDMALECDYRVASDLLKNKKYDEAKLIFDKLNRLNYRDAGEMAKETNYRKAMDLFDAFMNANPGSKSRTYIRIDTALDLFKSLSGYSDADRMARQVEEAIYQEGIALFDKVYEFVHKTYADTGLLGASEIFETDVLNTQRYFSLVPDKEESKQYYEVCAILNNNSLDWAKKAESLSDMWAFKPAQSMLLSNGLIPYFMIGSWNGERRYVNVEQAEDVCMMGSDFYEVSAEDYYTIEDLVYSVGSDERGWTKVARFSFTDKNTMIAYVFAEGKNYTLKRS